MTSFQYTKLKEDCMINTYIFITQLQELLALAYDQYYFTYILPVLDYLTIEHFICTYLNVYL